mgnify:CR=1 FL=1
MKTGTDFSSLRFLLVEDNAYTQKLLSEVMKAFGVPDGNLRTAVDGSSALEILKDHPVDVVITDALMQPVDGIALTKAIRSSKRKAICDVPIILCTAYSEKHRIAEARDAGVTGIVVKPFSAQTLHERICDAVENPRANVQSDSFLGPDRRRKADEVDVEKRGKPDVHEV